VGQCTQVTRLTWMALSRKLLALNV